MRRGLAVAVSLLLVLASTSAIVASGGDALSALGALTPATDERAPAANATPGHAPDDGPRIDSQTGPDPGLSNRGVAPVRHIPPGATGDSIEVGSQSASADTDGDGMSGREELLRGTDPSRVDTDDDGLNDSRELSLGTDPGDPDTDGDRLADGWEVHGRTGGVALPGADPLR